MNPTKELLSLTAKMIDGELFEYDDGYVIDVKYAGFTALFTYSETGELEKTEIKEQK